MKKSVILSFIRLLYIESQLAGSLGNSIVDIRELLELLKGKVAVQDQIQEELMTVLKEMIKHDFKEPMEESLFRFEVEDIYSERPEMVALVFEIEDIKLLTKEIFSLRRKLVAQLRIVRMQTKLSKANYLITKTDMEPEEISEELDSVVDVISRNNMNGDGAEAVTESISMTNKQGLKDLFAKIKDDSDPGAVWKTHLQGVNDMLQGGMRSGQMVFINGVQHSFKSGLSLTMFISLALLNPPKESKRPGKPTLVWLSMEDDMRKVIGDVYGFLKVWDDPLCDRINLIDIDIDEATEFVSSRLEESGYDVQFHRVDSSDYSFKKLFDFLTKLEMEGASLRVVGIDYIANIPKTGCSTGGALGADTRELVRRIRNWMQSRDILCLSPHQLNTQAKQLIRDGLPAHELVPKVLKNGYTADSSQIDQELDVEIALNPFTIDGKDYLMIGCGKHKLNSVIEDKDKLITIVDFPDNGNKIQPDVLGIKPYHGWHKREDVESFIRGGGDEDDVEGVFYKEEEDEE